MSSFQALLYFRGGGPAAPHPLPSDIAQLHRQLADRRGAAIRLRLVCHEAALPPCGTQHRGEVRAPSHQRARRQRSRRREDKGVKFGRKPKPTAHQTHEAITRRTVDDEMLRSIGRSYNVDASTISRLT